MWIVQQQLLKKPLRSRHLLLPLLQQVSKQIILKEQEEEHLLTSPLHPAAVGETHGGQSPFRLRYLFFFGWSEGERLPLYDVSYDMNNDTVDEYAGHTRICKGGFENAGDGQVWHPRTVCWQGSTGRFCDLTYPAIETSTGMGQKNSPAEDILRPRLLIHELSPYLWTFFSTLPMTVTPPFREISTSGCDAKSRELNAT